jgi:hypothetical protein
MTTDFALGHLHTCASIGGSTLRCWGYGSSGRLGLASTLNIGDDEQPTSVQPVKVF